MVSDPVDHADQSLPTDLVVAATSYPPASRATRPLSLPTLGSGIPVRMVERGHRVLVVDDNHDLQLDSYLHQSGYAFSRLAEPWLLVHRVREQQPDIVVINHTDPTTDPAALCRTLKQHRTTAAVPIILLAHDHDHRMLTEAVYAGIDDYLIVPADLVQLHARIKMVLLRLERARQASPLTGLPGSVAVEQEVECRLRDGEQFVICYSDLANFKAFNDTYGIAHGNRVLQFVSQTIAGVVDEFGTEHDFVGHVGGDDFIFLLESAQADMICATIISQFDRQITAYYSPAARDLGYIIAADRSEQVIHFPIMTISIAGVAMRDSSLSFTQASEAATNIKRYLKTQHTSQHLIDRREAYRLPANSTIQIVQG